MALATSPKQKHRHKFKSIELSTLPCRTRGEYEIQQVLDFKRWLSNKMAECAVDVK